MNSIDARLETIIRERIAADVEVSECLDYAPARDKLRAMVRLLAAHGACLAYFLELHHNTDRVVMDTVRKSNDLFETTKEFLNAEQRAFRNMQ